MGGGMMMGLVEGKGCKISVSNGTVGMSERYRQ